MSYVFIIGITCYVELFLLQKKHRLGRPFCFFGVIKRLYNLSVKKNELRSYYRDSVMIY